METPPGRATGKLHKIHFVEFTIERGKTQNVMNAFFNYDYDGIFFKDMMANTIYVMFVLIGQYSA